MAEMFLLVWGRGKESNEVGILYEEKVAFWQRQNWLNKNIRFVGWLMLVRFEFIPHIYQRERQWMHPITVNQVFKTDRGRMKCVAQNFRLLCEYMVRISEQVLCFCTYSHQSEDFVRCSSILVFDMYTFPVYC